MHYDLFVEVLSSTPRLVPSNPLYRDILVYDIYNSKPHARKSVVEIPHAQIQKLRAKLQVNHFRYYDRCTVFSASPCPPFSFLSSHRSDAKPRFLYQRQREISGSWKWHFVIRSSRHEWSSNAGYPGVA